MREPQGPYNTGENIFSADARVPRNINGDLLQDVAQVGLVPPWLNTDLETDENSPPNDLNHLKPHLAPSSLASDKSASDKPCSFRHVAHATTRFPTSLDRLTVDPVQIPPIRKVTAPYMAAGFAMATHANAQGRWKDCAPMQVSV